MTAAEKETLWMKAYAACQSEDVYELVTCLEQDPKLLWHQKQKMYLIHVAFEAGCAEICKEILSFGEEHYVNLEVLEDGLERTVLQIAISKDRVDLVKLLASFGYNIQNCYGWKENFYFFEDACCYAAYRGSCQICDFHLQTFPGVDKTEAFFIAVKYGKLAVCEVFLKHDRSYCLRADSTGDFPIIHAALHNRVDVIKLLIYHGADINIQGEAQYTALHGAMLEEHIESVLYLLQQGADCEIKDEDGAKPYQLGCYMCFAEKGYLLDTLITSSRGIPLMVLEELDLDIINLLVTDDNNHYDITDLLGSQYLSLGEIVRLILGIGVYFEGLGRYQERTFSQLCREAIECNKDLVLKHQGIDCILAIIEGAVFATINGEGITQVMKLMFDLNQCLLFTKLLSFLSNSIGNYYFIHNIILSGCDGKHPSPIPYMSLLLHHWTGTPAVNSIDFFGSSPLVHAITSIKSSEQQMQITKLLLADGASVHINGIEGNSPLMLAVSKLKSSPEQRLEMVKLLLSYGADVHHTNNKGQTILYVCGCELELHVEADQQLLAAILEHAIGVKKQQLSGMKRKRALSI